MVALLIKDFFRLFPPPMVIDPRNDASFNDVRYESVDDYNSYQNVFETFLEVDKLSKNYIEQVPQSPVVEENAEEETCADYYLETGE